MKYNSIFTILVGIAATASSVSYGALDQRSPTRIERGDIVATSISRYSAAEDLNFNVLQFGEATDDEINFASAQIEEFTSQVQMAIPSGSEVIVLDERTENSGKTVFKIMINRSLYAWVLSEELSQVGFYEHAQFAGSMIVPLRGKISSLPGRRINPIRRKGTESHAGTDIRAPKGTPIKAAAAGVVEIARWLGGYGKVVYLTHPGRIQTRYAHMSAIKVKEGQQVSQGMVVGLVGSTGRTTGPHLHFEKRSL